MALDGEVEQDIYETRDKSEEARGSMLRHSQDADRWEPTHKVDIIKETALYGIYGEYTLVNSFHHQAVSVPSDKVTVSAYSEDGIVEAYEIVTPKQWLLAVQFHPEMLVRADDSWLALFEAFIKAAR